MKLRSILFVLKVFFVSFIASQSITLEIPQHHVSEENQKAFTTFSTKKYYFVTFFKANFFTAFQYCQQFNNMELMTIDSKEEEVAFLNLINSKDFEFKSVPHFWTSGTDLGEEGKFFYLTNGKSIGQLNWAENEPNNGKKQDTTETENCMAYTTTDNLKFFRLFDKFCSLKFNFVCQDIPQKPQFSNSIEL